MSSDLVDERSASRLQLVSGQLSRRSCRSIDEVGDPQAEIQQLTLSVTGQKGGRQPGLVDRTPEAIARPGEVMAGCARIESRIDTDEENAQVVGDDVLNCLVDGRTEVGRGRSVAGELGWRARRAVFLRSQTSSAAAR